MRTRWITGWLTLAMLSGSCFGEEPAEPAKFYKLEFVVKEVAGTKVLNSRTYSTMVSTRGANQIRAGSKVPFAISPNETTQIDLGVNIDVNGVKEIQDRLAFQIMAEESSIAEGSTDQKRPTIRQNRWSSNVIVPLKKPTLLFSSENVDAKTQMEVEVTATLVP
jgi:hypothetical protein